MSSIRRKRTLNPTPPDGIDYGPAVVRGPDGSIRPWPGAAAIVLEDRVDPDAITRDVRAARRRDGLRDLLSRKSITVQQWDAAERFRNDLATAAGARVIAEKAGVRVAFDATRYGPTEYQIDAQARVRAAWRHVGLIASGVVSWVVVSGGSVGDYDAATRRRGRSGTAMLIGALNRLAAYYDTVPEKVR